MTFGGCIGQLENPTLIIHVIDQTNWMGIGIRSRIRIRGVCDP